MDFAKKQILKQKNEFIKVVTDIFIAKNNSLVNINLKCEYNCKLYADSIMLETFLNYEPEVFANSVCKEYNFSNDCARYISFTIRNQIYAYQKQKYYESVDRAK